MKIAPSEMLKEWAILEQPHSKILFDAKALNDAQMKRLRKELIRRNLLHQMKYQHQLQVEVYFYPDWDSVKTGDTKLAFLPYYVNGEDAVDALVAVDMVKCAEPVYVETPFPLKLGKPYTEPEPNSAGAYDEVEYVDADFDIAGE